MRNMPLMPSPLKLQGFAAQQLLGREIELASMRDLVDDARDGTSGAMVLVGEAGVGKTALLDSLVADAADFRLLRIVGIESEMQLGYGALHQLLLPLMGLVERLPAPQRSAVHAAFGMSRLEKPDAFMLGLACLTILADASTHQPILCVIDDAQWLDDESLSVLAFVARRVHGTSLVLIFAARDEGSVRNKLASLLVREIEGLRDEAARELLAAVVQHRLDESVALRIVASTGGNPLALIELGSGLQPGQLDGGSLLPEPLPLTRRVEARFLRQVHQLSEHAQLAVLIAAAEPTGELGLFWRAIKRLGVTDEAVTAAQDAQLLIVARQVELRHPLIRSAVYYGASPADRRRVHLVLAELADSEGGADRIAWHRACAVEDRDEEVAAELESAAQRARERGGYVSAAAFHTRAAQLTPDPSVRCARLLNAVEAQTTAGAVVRARALLGEAAALANSAALQTRMTRLDCGIREIHGGSWETASLLLEASKRLAPLDRDAAQDTMLQAMTAAFAGGRFVVDSTPSVVAAAAKSLFEDFSWDDVTGQALSGLATLYLDGFGPAVPALRRVVHLVESDNSSSDRALKGLTCGVYAASALADPHATHRISRRSADLSQETGATLQVGWALLSLGISELVIGSIIRAEEQFATRRELIESEQELVDIGGVLTSAWQGREAETLERAAEALVAATEHRQGRKLGYVEWALAVLELGLGHYGQAVEHARQASREHLGLLRAVLLPDLIEAATKSGDLTVAEEALHQYESIAAATQTPLVLGLLARSRALVVDGSAEEYFVESIDLLVACDAAMQVARTRLVYGEWLRRVKRRRDAREQLRAAFDHFTADGAGAFAARARIELMATGETARKRSVETADGLTPQEAEVARIAATGCTNREIAQQLFISDSTVDYHLGKVFRKLGVSSRRDLGRVLVK